MPFSFDTEHPVFLLAHEGKLDALREALSADPDLAKLRASDRSTLLHFASQGGHLETIKWLLGEGGSNINECNLEGYTALLFAAANGHLKTIKWLLSEGGSSIIETDDSGNTALLFAAYNGHLKTIKWLLSEGGSSINECNLEGETALLLAAANGHLKTVKWLLNKGGSKINEYNHAGVTALLFAAGNGHLETVKWLLGEGGSKINETNKEDMTALLLAVVLGHLETVKWLLGEGGSNINECNLEGYTALLLAATNGHLEAVQWLLVEGGSNINDRNQDGSSAFLLSALLGHLETVKWLLAEGGSNINETDHYGNTALMYASANGHHDVLQLLLRNKKITYRALVRVLFQDQRELDTASEALISTKIESYESCIERAKSDMPGFVFQETETHVLIKDELYCPISYELIEDPVVAADGVLYDKKHIEKWLNDGHDTSPKTGKLLEHKLTVPVLSYKKELDDIHQAIERIYQQVQDRKSAFTSSEHICSRPPSSRFFDDASEGDLTAPALSGSGAGKYSYFKFK